MCPARQLPTDLFSPTHPWIQSSKGTKEHFGISCTIKCICNKLCPGGCIDVTLVNSFIATWKGSEHWDSHCNMFVGTGNIIIKESVRLSDSNLCFPPITRAEIISTFIVIILENWWGKKSIPVLKGDHSKYYLTEREEHNVGNLDLVLLYYLVQMEGQGHIAELVCETQLCQPPAKLVALHVSVFWNLKLDRPLIIEAMGARFR